ncbi:MAG TPA: gamma-glutamylcyclotransferase family protein [Methyloceanibacter sp.]
MPQHLFVGTLRFEYPNPLAVKLKSQAIFICKGSAPGVLYDLGWYPGAVFNDAVRTRVIGEVIALGNAERLMAQLDDYEAIPEPNKRFRRVVIKVRLELAARSRRGLTRRSSFPQPGVPSRAVILFCIFAAHRTAESPSSESLRLPFRSFNPFGNSMETAGLSCRNDLMTEYLFVYGTLRSEFPHPLAKRLSTRAKFIGKGSTPGLLYDFGWYPGAKFDAGARTHVVGEVFSLKNAARLLAELDHYEGTAEPGNAFRRVLVKVRLDRGGTIDAWSYEMGDSKARRRPIESGDFIHHRRLKDQRPVRD